MKLEAVSEDMEARITAGRRWLESATHLEFPGPLVRKHPTTLQLKKFLDTPGRAERHGLGFIVSIATQDRPHRFQINVRLKPRRTEGSKVDSYPYVVSYVVDQNSGQEILICFDHIVEPKRYASALGLTVQAWYLRWLQLALERGGGKLFAPEVRLQM